MTTKARILLALIVGLLLALMIVGSAWKADAMPLDSSDVFKPIRDGIDYDARYVDPTCYKATKSVGFSTLLGRAAEPAYTVEFCTNKAHTKVRSINVLCWDKGGYYYFDGCDKQHSSTGFSTLDVKIMYGYHWIDILGIRLDKDILFELTVYPNGHVDGTVSWRTLP